MSLIPMDRFVSKEVRIEPSENGVTLYLGTVPIKDFANEELACAYVDDSLIEDKSSLIPMDYQRAVQKASQASIYCGALINKVEAKAKVNA